MDVSCWVSCLDRFLALYSDERRYFLGGIACGDDTSSETPAVIQIPPPPHQMWMNVGNFLLFLLKNIIKSIQVVELEPNHSIRFLTKHVSLMLSPI